MVIIENKMDLFKVDLTKYTLAHCISLDCALGAGIAKIFDIKYPDMKPYLKRVVSENHLNYPVTIMYTSDNLNDYCIFNLITKEKYWHKPTYETITKTIQEMKYMCEQYGIKYLAIPKIGCGLDRLSWNKVKEILEEEFKGLDIEILVCYM